MDYKNTAIILGVLLMLSMLIDIWIYVRLSEQAAKATKEKEELSRSLHANAQEQIILEKRLNLYQQRDYNPPVVTQTWDGPDPMAALVSALNTAFQLGPSAYLLAFEEVPGFVVVGLTQTFVVKGKGWSTARVVDTINDVYRLKLTRQDGSYRAECNSAHYVDLPSMLDDLIRKGNVTDPRRDRRRESYLD